VSLSGTVLGDRVSLRVKSNTNNISSAGLHGLDQRQHRSEEVDLMCVRGRTHLVVCRCLPV